MGRTRTHSLKFTFICFAFNSLRYFLHFSSTHCTQCCACLMSIVNFLIVLSVYCLVFDDVKDYGVDCYTLFSLLLIYVYFCVSPWHSPGSLQRRMYWMPLQKLHSEHWRPSRIIIQQFSSSTIVDIIILAYTEYYNYDAKSDWNDFLNQ